MIKEKSSRNIVLIGFMGSGKTLVSISLAKKLNMKRISTDEMIERQEKRSVAEIVAARGWSYFRKLEHEIIKKISIKKNVVIDCGGGVVLNLKNLKSLKINGIIFYLKVSTKVIYNRLKGDKTRPLISGPNPQARIKEILKNRLPLYSQADVIVNASHPSVDVAVARIIKKL
jgi:shikimate kinase